MKKDLINLDNIINGILMLDILVYHGKMLVEVEVLGKVKTMMEKGSVLQLLSEVNLIKLKELLKCK